MSTSPASLSQPSVLHVLPALLRLGLLGLALAHLARPLLRQLRQPLLVLLVQVAAVRQLLHARVPRLQGKVDLNDNTYHCKGSHNLSL